MIDFLETQPEYETDLFQNKKSKSTLESSLGILKEILPELQNLSSWDYETLHELLINFAAKKELKNGIVMWPVRIAVSGKTVTPGGAIEILEILGKEESLERIKNAIKKLES